MLASHMRRRPIAARPITAVHSIAISQHWYNKDGCKQQQQRQRWAAHGGVDKATTVFFGAYETSFFFRKSERSFTGVSALRPDMAATFDTLEVTEHPPEVFYNDGKARKFEVTLLCTLGDPSNDRNVQHELQTILMYERGDEVESQNILEKMERNAIRISPSGTSCELSFRINQGARFAYFTP
jgi:hypothetical protein